MESDAGEPSIATIHVPDAVAGGMPTYRGLQRAATTLKSYGELRALAGHWAGLARADRLPGRADLDPVALSRWLGNLILVQVVDGGADFRFRLYGSKVAESNHRDMTGLSVNALPATDVAIVAGGYREALARRAPVYRGHTIIDDGRTFTWERVILPLASDGMTIDMLLVGIYRIRGDERA
jgi:hypothetical protein